MAERCERKFQGFFEIAQSMLRMHGKLLERFHGQRGLAARKLQPELDGGLVLLLALELRGEVFQGQALYLLGKASCQRLAASGDGFLL